MVFLLEQTTRVRDSLFTGEIGAVYMNDEDTQDTKNGMSIEAKNSKVNQKQMQLHRLQLRENSAKREIRRLRNSVSFRLGLLLTSHLKNPLKLLILPFTLIHLIVVIGLERIGKKGEIYVAEEQINYLSAEKKNCVVFFPTNGVGFGHFTRMLAVAKRLQTISPDTEIVFFTTMPTIHILYNENFVTYHIAGRKKHKSLSPSKWNALLEESLSLVFANHSPSSFIFDGAYPYRGMLNAIKNWKHQEFTKFWMRRGMFKNNSQIPIDSIQHFDVIIHPQDSDNKKLTHTIENVDIVSCAPIVLLDENELMGKVDARLRLGVPLEATVVYVQLGAGRINEIDSEIRLTVESLLLKENIFVVLGESMLGDRINLPFVNVRIIRDYPNSMYFNAFDFSIQAGGYNSYHETRKFGIPALFYPNLNTGMDDQLTRCLQAEREGWGKVIKLRTSQSIKEGIDSMLNELTRFKSDEQENGALFVAKELEGSL